jgi:hypothetical protein
MLLPRGVALLLTVTAASDASSAAGGSAAGISALPSCNAQVYTTQRSMSQAQLALVYEGVYHGCDGCDFGTTTCDGAAMFMDVLWNTQLDGLAPAIAQRHACSYTQNQVATRNAFVGPLMSVGQSDAERNGNLTLLKDVLAPAASHAESDTTSYAQVVVALYKGKPSNMQSAHAFSVSRDNNAGATTPFHFWQANQGQYDLWTWLNQTANKRANKASFPGPSAYASSMGSTSAGKLYTAINTAMSGKTLYKDFEPNFFEAVAWTKVVPGDNPMHTDFKPDDVVGAMVLVWAGSQPSSACVSNLAAIQKFPTSAK